MAEHRSGARAAPGGRPRSSKARRRRPDGPNRLRWLLRGAVGLGGVALVVAVIHGVSRIPGLLARMDAFRATGFAVEDARFLGVEEVLRWARIPSGASVWDDPSAWEDRLRDHPLVEDVEIRRDLPRGLVFRVREKTPVALVARPTLEPVDAEGRTLPVDPSLHRLDLPVIRSAVAGGVRELSAEELRALAREVGRLRVLDPGLVAALSDLALAPRGGVVATLLDPRVELRFRAPLTSLRLHEGMQALAHASERVGADAVRVVDLRYDDQVVVRLAEASSNRRRAD
ncbi:MAG: cell division protein FtsQ/DivIB [Gemmatimonadota bacterium]